MQDPDHTGTEPSGAPRPAEAKEKHKKSMNKFFSIDARKRRRYETTNHIWATDGNRKGVCLVCIGVRD